MSCEEIKMPDGTVILAHVKPGEKLTDEDKRILAEWVEFCRNRGVREQRRRNRRALPGANPIQKRGAS